MDAEHNKQPITTRAPSPLLAQQKKEEENKAS